MTYRIKPEHNPKNYLKAILESMEHYNIHERLDIALWLYEGYKKASTVPNSEATKKALILEMISKWIQGLEDMAILCLMIAGKFIKYKKRPIIASDKLPFEVYVFVDNRSILQFYTVAKSGLGKKVIAQIYGYKTAHQLLKEKVIQKKEYPYFKQEIDKLYKAAKENLNKIGALYSFRKKRGGRQMYGKLVETYFKTKHGYKVLHSTPTAKLLWTFDEKDSVLVNRVDKLRSGRKIMRVSLYNEFTDSDIQLLVDRIKGWTDVISEIVGSQLRKLDNPDFLVPMIRRIKTEELIKASNLKVGRNDSCPCDSGLKYKKCCGK